MPRSGKSASGPKKRLGETASPVELSDIPAGFTDVTYIPERIASVTRETVCGLKILISPGILEMAYAALPVAFPFVYMGVLIPALHRDVSGEAVIAGRPLTFDFDMDTQFSARPCKIDGVYRGIGTSSQERFSNVSLELCIANENLDPESINLGKVATLAGKLRSETESLQLDTVAQGSEPLNSGFQRRSGNGLIPN